MAHPTLPRPAVTWRSPNGGPWHRLAARLSWARPRLRLALAGVGVLVGLLLYVAAFRATWVDDAYIQLQYARTLLEDGTWGFYAGHPANTATSPLNVLLTAAAGLFLGSVERAVPVLTALELAALLWVLIRLSRRLFDRDFFGWFAFVAVSTNLLLLSTIGMESILFALLLVASVYLFLVRRWLTMAATLGLLTLARPDGVLLLAVLLPLASAPARRRGTMLLVYAAVIAPWFIFSWVHLGSFVPDTLLIKLGEQAWGPVSFGEGLAVYLRRFPFETVASLFLAPLCVFPLWRCGRDVVRVVTVVVAYGALHFAVYAALAVPPYHWYFVHQLVPMVLVASVGAAYYVARVERGRVGRLARAAVVVPTVGLLLLALDEGVPLAEAPINTNWATSEQYRSISLWMRRNVDEAEAVAVRGEIGTIAFYSEHVMVNEFSDMSLADALIEEADYDALPGVGPLVRLNFLWRREPAPLPDPVFEVVNAPAAAEPGCLPSDGTCWLARDGTTEWVGRNRILVRHIG